MHRLSFITLNVRGINSSRKRRAIFRQLHNKNASVIFLQETYSSNNQEKLQSTEWGSKIHFCHGSKHSRGVAILSNPKIQDTKLCMFQYKIIHNILPYGSKLYKMKISNSPLCVHCNSLETLPHMLVNCTEINSFWAKIISWWNHQSGDCYLVDELSILYGYNPEDKRTLIFNYFILLGKRHIFAQRFEQKTPNIDLFFDLC